jgi:hypothetical protein
MSETVTVHGQSLRNQRATERAADLDYMSLHAHPDGKPGSPKWVVLHHGSDGTEPREFVFENGRELLDHLREHASIPPDAHEPSDALGREVMPAELQNRYGRGR